MKHTWTKETAIAAISKHSGLTYCSAYDYLLHKHSDDESIRVLITLSKPTTNTGKVTR